MSIEDTMRAMEEGAKACPFCGTGPLLAEVSRLGGSFVCTVECDNCGARGPRKMMRDSTEVRAAAINDWNERVSP